MAVARNDAQLLRMVMPDLKKAVKYVVDEILKENEKLIQEIVYDAYSPEIYDRTGQFKKAWETYSDISGDTATGEFSYAPEKLSENAPHHASIVDGEPIGDYLAEIIYEGLSGAIYQHGYAKNYKPFKGQAWTKKRDVWDKLNKKIGKQKIKQLFEEGMRRQGINFQRHNAAIGYSD